MRSQQYFLITALAAVAATAMPADVNAQSEEIEEVVVTGSRIQRDPNTIAAQPVQSISSEDIKLSGEFSIADVVNDIPALLSSTTSEQSIDSAFADGANVLSLRGLGVNRTLVLVDGRRHVAGVSGTAAVDVGSIPMGLVERVEVLTGGASAVYGADAVTGVVNFILKDDFEGFQIDASRGISNEWDGDQTTLSALWGKNFDNSRGNISVAVDYRRDEGLRVNERGGDSAFIGSGRDWVNPAKRFQQGDIDPSTMPNFAQYYNFDNTGLTDFGLPVPGTDADFITAFTDAFGAAPTLTAAEQAFIAAAAAAPQRAVLPGRTFPFTSGYGYIIPGNPFTFAGFDPETPIDLDGNGRPDCLDSFTGYNSVFGAESFGVVGGCWNVTAGGQYRPVQDGLVSGNFQGFGGDSFNTIQQDNGLILLPDEKLTVNLVGRYDLTDTMTAFGEVKYSTSETSNEGQPSSFWDLLFGAPDNPFLPDFIQPIADANGGVAITIDPIGLGEGRIETERDTVRLVAGLEGEFSNGWRYEVSANYGRFEQNTFNSNALINDRFLAAIDAVTDPTTGQAACRSSVDVNAPATTTPFNIPAYDPGYFSFTPGDGSCVPLNIWAGATGITQAAVDWVTRATNTEVTIDQTVISGYVAGDSSDYFSLPDGPIDFAAGFEYRDESSEAIFDPFARGILPAGSPFGEGTLLSDVSGNSNLLFRPALGNANEIGEYDATDLFVEVSAPLLIGRQWAQELVVDAAVRLSDYSTIGNATTWKASISYAPVNDIRFRATLSEAVRAPNITELFAPTTGITSRPVDPCDAAQINAIAADNPTLAGQYQANCVADLQSIGVDPFDANGTYVFADPLSAAFGGIASGNANLDEEVAETITVGFVLQPRFLEGFTFSIDYWDIEIEDAIASVSDQDIVDACYSGTSLNGAFCSLFTRNGDANSLQFGGFNFIQRSLVNFAQLETNGFDFTAGYKFDIGEHGFDIKVSGTKVHELNRFADPLDLSVVDVELGEVNRPEWAGNVFASWFYGDWSVGWQSQYQGEQLLSFLEIDTAEALYGDSVFQDGFWQHDLNFSFQYSEELSLYGGIKNVTEEDPFITDFAFPASPRGRFFFVGGTYSLQ